MPQEVHRFKFTKSELLRLALPEQGKRLTVYDSAEQKLTLRVTATGAKTFYVVKRTGASMTWYKLGRFPEMTVEQARSEAAKFLGEFARGANPAEARRAVRAEVTFGEVFERYLVEKKKRDGSRLTAKTKQVYRGVLGLYLVGIRSRKLSEITREQVRAIHWDASKKSEAQADQALRVVSAVFGFAADRELFAGENPASGIQKNPTVERDRFVQEAELPFLFEAIELSDIGDFFLLALFTGARRSNLQEMQWRHVDMGSGIWHIGKTKNGTAQNVTLSPEALSVLERRQPHADESPFVFPGPGKTGHLVEPKKAWAAVKCRATVSRLLELLDGAGKLSEQERELAAKLRLGAPVKALERYRIVADALKINPAAYDMTDIRIHDLRRTLGSWQARGGSSLVVIGKSLNHKTTQATMIYSRLDIDPVRRSVNAATSAMAVAGGMKDAADVQELPVRSKR
jgi:integrase